ncbi:ABC transporter permease [candidate division KSB1 bacterium]|nr:ABC transporter permease [candidate division KSB1 bacterium]
MLKLIIRKELLETIQSKRFIWTFSVCSALILLTFYMGAENYQLNLARYEAAKAENLRKLEGVTDWLMVRSHRIFLPPAPLEVLVNGVANDIGRTVEVVGRGELTASGSRYNEDPLFAAFRFLDLDFIFQIVLSLFAILFAYNAINGEKEAGTLRLSFANAVPKDQYILGKLLGAFLALGLPLLIPILLGCLLLPILKVPLSPAEWLRLGLILLTGIFYFGIFLTLSIFVSAITTRSAHAFSFLLVIWILTIFIIPRAAVLIAGRMVPVPSVDELAFQKSRYQAQLWQEDQVKMNQYHPENSGDPDKMLAEFHKFMEELADAREKKANALATRLNESRRNRQQVQERLALGLARLSPAALFSLATTNLASTSLALKAHFMQEVYGYQQTYRQFILAKTGMNPGSGMIVMRVRNDDSEEQEKPIDPKELPPFLYQKMALPEILGHSLLDLSLLVLLNIVFFVAAYVKFLRYDVR